MPLHEYESDVVKLDYLASKGIVEFVGKCER